MTWDSNGLKAVQAILFPPPPKDFRVVPTPLFDRFSVAFLALDWIIFGSLHFSMHAATLRMLPDWVPLPDAVVVATGFAEVAVGISLLVHRLRRVAALCSILLLVMLTPAVFHMLADPEALPFADAQANRVWRFLLVPHAVLVAICSIHLVGKPYPDRWAPRAGPSARLGDGLFSVGLVAVVLLLCNAAGFLAMWIGVHANRPTAALWMMMCLAIGGLLGFLFAVPRAGAQPSSATGLQPNRNIEEISDWLTKIIVGLGLVNFRQIGDFLMDRSAELAPLFGVSNSFCLALIVYFFVAGLLEGYLLTRMFLQLHFADSRQA